MRRLRMIVCLFFVISCGIFGFYVVKTRLVEDNEPPKLTCDKEELSVSVEAKDEEILKGVKAEDNRDGDITDSVRISSMSHFISKGKRTVTYIVFDQACHAGTISRTLNYTDYHSPRIFMKKPLRMNSNEVNNKDLKKDMKAEDCLDGDLSNQIRFTLSDNFYNAQPGEYDLMLQVSNSAGDVCAVPVQVTLTDSSERQEGSKRYPMLSDYIVYTKVNEELDLNSYITGVMQGNSEYTFEKDGDYLNISRDQISIQSNVDYTKKGVYTVEYTYAADGEPTAVTKLYVVVEE